MDVIILVVIFVCGQADTIIVKYPDGTSRYTHNVNSEGVLEEYYKLLEKKHILINYVEDRGTCA